MDSSHLLALVFGALVGASGIGLYLAYRGEQGRRERAEAALAAGDAERRQLQAELAEQVAELRNFRRARNNKLYRHSMDDLGFAASQSLIRVRVMRSQLIEELNVIDQLLSLAPKE